MSFWLWIVVGLAAGAGPSLLAGPAVRPWLARRWWWLAFALVAMCIILPFGLVLVMFLSDGAFDAIAEMGQFLLGAEFGWATALMVGCLLGSGAMAWLHRHASRLQGPPMSAQVQALAGDPDTQWQAVALYRQETGADIAVATDVVEGYDARRHAQPLTPGRGERPLGALEWMYLGFATAWYIVLGSGFALTFRSQTNHFLTGLAFFVFIPGLFSGCCGLCAGLLSARLKAALQSAFRAEALTRRYAFAAGLAAGGVSVAGAAAVACVAYSVRHSEVSALIAVAGIAAILAVSPLLGLWLLKKRSP